MIGGVLLICTIMMFCLTGCSFMDKVMSHQASSNYLQTLSDDQATSSLSADYDGQGQEYYDKATGLKISKARYYGNNICDAIKRYGAFIAIPCFGLGFFIRKNVKGSTTVRKLALILESTLPLWILLAYGVSYAVDKFFK